MYHRHLDIAVNSNFYFSGDIYVLGGYDGETYLRDVEKLSPRKQHWERVPDMIQTRSYFTAAAIHDRIYAIGGYGPTHHAR